MQIECIHSINYTTVLLIETHYLPDRQSTLFEKIDELCSIILRRDNEIISWGPIESELANFTDFGLFDIGKETRSSNMQSLFRRWYDDTKTHPVTERREPRTGRSTVEIFDTPSDDHERKRTNDHSQRRTRSDDHSSVGTWSLQDAIASTLSLFLDKTETLNRWKCGLDPILNTWQQQRFNRHRVDEEYERTKRARMTTYAINDCVAVTALYFHIHPTRSDELHNEKMRAMEFDYQLSDISDDELTNTADLHFDRPITKKPGLNDRHVSIMETTEEMGTDRSSQMQHLAEQFPTADPALAKKERQRRKNMKLKLKQRTRPEFQYKIKRPIYHRYDFRKIRAQLLDDDVHTTHQVTIDRNRGEVLIGVKSKEEQQRATKIMRINYFSKGQYNSRWG